MNKVAGNNKGFTIIELMIATAVFSVVLLLCTYGLLEIGRTYYRGVTAARTQEAARRILTDVSEGIKFNGGDVVINEAGGVHCIGNKRYSFVINRMYSDSSPNNHALVSDEFGTCSAGVPRQNMNAAPANNGTEMLGNRMRISRFSVEPVAGADGLYRVTVRVVTGEDDLLVDRNGNPSVTTADNPIECKSERAGSQFCAVSELTTTVRKRL